VLRLIPAALHRQLYRLAFAARCRWLRLRGGKVSGCNVIARDDRGWLLMVRHSYGSGSWQFPGGGVGRNEPPEEAARREFAEELGCEVSALTLLGTIEEPYHGAINVVHVFSGCVSGQPRADGREVVEARYFPPDALPPQLGPRARRRLSLMEI
jgi:8-oxo-dGTP pyrophosphatase MutT (NUDIX family)